MSRKSVVKGICDIFEGDPCKSPTFTKYCDLGPAFNTSDNQQQQRDQLSSKMSNISVKSKDSNPTESTKNTKNGSDQYFGTIKDRIGKFNAESTGTKPSSTTTKNRSLRHNRFVPNNDGNKRTQSLASNRRNKLDLRIYDEISADFSKSNSLSPKSPSSKSPSSKSPSSKSPSSKSPSPKVLNKDKSTMSLRKTQPPSNNRASTKNAKSSKDCDEKINSTKCNNSEETDLFPVIPPKPKYINKIKPHPKMSSKSKQDLQAKIKVFNNLANSDSKIQKTKLPDYVNVRSELDSKSNSETWNLKTKRNRKSLPKRHSKEDQYDTIFSIGKSLKPKAQNTPSPTEDNSYDIIANLNDKFNSQLATKSNETYESSPSKIYDVVQISNSSNSTPFKPKIPDNDINSNKIKYSKNTKLVKNSKNLRAKSKDNILEVNGYVVVGQLKDDDDSSSSSSSDDDLATEYDVIENLDVTKITVERRYKVPNNEKQESTFNVTRETYYDHNLNPRIERISRNVRTRHEEQMYDEVYASRSSLVVQELLQTELVYFKGLLRVYEDYILYFKESANICNPNMNKVFGNFEDIYRQQIDFYGELTKCHNNVTAIAETFLRNNELFRLYEEYILNKPISTKFSTGECLEAIKARDRELGNKLDLESFLLTPFQRLIRYRLLLKNLQEALQDENKPSSKLDEAADYLENLIESTNLQVKIMQSIRHSPIDLSSKGKLLMVDGCFLKHNGKKYLSTVILFEGVIIFTRKESDTYIYKGSINLSDVYIRSIAEEVTSFQLQNFTLFKRKHDNKYVYDLEVSSAKVKHEWVKKIESLLWNQFAAHKRS